MLLNGVEKTVPLDSRQTKLWSCMMGESSGTTLTGTFWEKMLNTVPKTGSSEDATLRETLEPRHDCKMELNEERLNRDGDWLSVAADDAS